MAIPEDTKKGYSIAHAGDGVYISRPHKKRGVVQKGMIQTIKTQVNDIGVVVAGQVSSENSQGGKVYLSDGLSPTLCAGTHDYAMGYIANDEITLKQVGILEGGKWDKINESCRRYYDADGLSPTIHTCQGGNTEPKVIKNLRIRKLIPLECIRLMDFDDEDFYKVKAIEISDTQIYKQAGNSIVVGVLVAIFRELF